MAAVLLAWLPGAALLLFAHPLVAVLGRHGRGLHLGVELRPDGGHVIQALGADGAVVPATEPHPSHAQRRPVRLHLTMDLASKHGPQ